MSVANPIPSDIQLLAQSSTEAIERHGVPLPRVSLVGDGLDCPLPPAVTEHIVRMLHLMADGQEVEVVPAQSELTIRQAAKFLSMSETRVIRLLDDNIIRYRQEGDERLVDRESMLEYDQKKKRGISILAEIARESQEMGLYDL